MHFDRTAISQEAKFSIYLALPLIAANLVQASSGFIGVVMIARLGRDALAGSALGWAIYIALIVFFFGMLNAVSVLVAQSNGANDKQGISLAGSQGLILGFLISIPMIVIMFAAPVVLPFMEKDPHIILIATRYLHAMIWCVMPLSILFGMEQFLIGLGKTRLVLRLSIIEVVMEILASWLLIFGKFGLPKCGVAGIGYGFAGVFVIMIVIMGLYLHYSVACRQFNVFANITKVSKKYFFELLRIGWPIGAMSVIEVAWFTIFVMFMSKISSDQLAAQQLTRQFWIIPLMMIFAIAQSTAVRVGYSVGENNREALIRSVYVNIVISTFVIICLAVTYIFIGKYLIAIDIDIHNPKNANLVNYATGFLAIASIGLIFDNVRFIAIGALRGLKDTKLPMYISFIAFWIIALPISYLLAFYAGMNGIGLWCGYLVAVIISMLVLVMRLGRLMKSADLTKLLV